MRKEKKEKKNKAVVPYNIPMLMASVLFCLTMITTHFTGDLYARYATSDTASDSARAAKFGTLTLTETVDGEVVGKNHTFTVIPGVDINKQVTVSYTGGETDVFVFVAMQRGSGWKFEGENTTSANMYKLLLGTFMDWEIDKTSTENPDGWNRLGTYTNNDGINEEVYYIKLEANETITDKPFFAVDDKGTADTADDTTITVSAFTPSEFVTAVQDGKGNLNFRAAVVQYGEFGSTIKTEPKFAEAAWKSIK